MRVDWFIELMGSKPNLCEPNLCEPDLCEPKNIGSHQKKFT